MGERSAGVDGRRTDTRARILEVASVHFRERGYSETTLQEIADELGVTKAALYYHFDSKAQILRALVEPVFAALEETLTQGFDCSTGDRRRDYLSALVGTFSAAGFDVASIARDQSAATEVRSMFSSTSLPDRVAADLVDGLVREGRIDRAAAELRVVGALSAIYGMAAARVRATAGASAFDRESRDLMVTVAAAALEAVVPTRPVT